MYTVKVQAEGGRFSAVVRNERIGYTFVGRQFEPGEPVEGRFAGEVRAEADAADWTKKLQAAGLKVS